MRWIAVVAVAVLIVATARGAPGGSDGLVRPATARDVVTTSHPWPTPSLSPSSSRCGPASSCTYTYHDPSTSKTYTYDFSSLCQETDYAIGDGEQHTYYANICGNAHHQCLPATWENVYKVGAAIVVWGYEPLCNIEATNCKDEQGNPACCTQDCEVMGVGAPHMSLLDPGNPETGGVRLLHVGALSSPSDPFWCQFDPVTGKQYKRQVAFEMLCDESVTGPAKPVAVLTNSSDTCHVRIQFKTAKACGRAAFPTAAASRHLRHQHP